MNPKAAAVQADAWLALGRLDDARQLLSEAEKLFPASPEILRALSRLGIKERRWSEAKAHADRWQAAQPGSPHARYLAGRCRFQLGQDDEALALLETLDPSLSRHEEFRDLPFYLGVLQARAGQPSAAIENLQSFLRRLPLHVEARTVLAAALQRAGRTPEAAVQWQKIALLNIRQSEKLRQEAVQLWTNGQPRESIARLADAVKLDPSNPELALNLARARADSGDREAASQGLRDYLAWNPDRAPAVGYLSQLLSDLKQHDEARLLAARYRALIGTSQATAEQ